MLEKLMEDLTFELKTTDLKTLFIEDPYRMQTVLDDHMRRMEELAEVAKKMVAEWEGK